MSQFKQFVAKNSTFASLVFASALIILIYSPGFSGSFIFDDFNSIVKNEKLWVDSFGMTAIWQWLNSGSPGVLGRPISMLTFGLNLYIAGEMEPASFKWGNAFFHVVAFFGVYGFCRSLLSVFSDRRMIVDTHVSKLALLIALYWALFPLQVSTVLYIVQRMTILSALFSFYALWVYIEWRREKCKTYIAVPSFILLSGLAFLSKENAVLLGGFILLLELFILNPQFGRPASEQKWTWYRRVLFAGAIVGGVVVFLYLHFAVGWYYSDYAARDFTLSERLFTQMRVVSSYIYWIVVPDLTQYGLFHDDMAVSKSWIDPISTLFAALLLVVLSILGFVKRKAIPWFAFGVFWFLLGHVLESTFIPLEMVFEHRNYLPSFGIVLILICSLYYIAHRVSRVPLFYLIAVIWLLFLSLVTTIRSAEWGDYPTQMRTAVERHPESARSNWGLGRWFMGEYQKGWLVNVELEKFYTSAMYYGMRASELDPNTSIPLLGIVASHCQMGKNIEDEWVTELEHRLSLPYRVENHGVLNDILNCALDRRDSLAVLGVADRLFEAVFQNTHIHNSMLSELKYVYALHLYKRGEYLKGIQIMEQSIESKKSENAYIRLLQFSFERGRKDLIEEKLPEFRNFLGEHADSNSNYQLFSKYADKCCDAGLKFQMNSDSD